MTLTLTNTFHNTSTTLRAKRVGNSSLGSYRISIRAWIAAHRRLCGMPDCECGDPGEFTGPDGRPWAIYEELGDAYVVCADAAL